eukprot:TRINITY_DN36652_c0_g1_i1.p1 TRINITY_DN36652_c0_g1~~TRINITY_DN36652_c0_g1_i1.p1  ORF type:complete len:483 (+),score=106.65 TRINITY_DN36652_c0_g1_i1:80-1528(+)
MQVQTLAWQAVPELALRTVSVPAALLPLSSSTAPSNSSGGRSNCRALLAAATCFASVSVRSRSRAAARAASGGAGEQSDEKAYHELAEWLRARGAYINEAVGLTIADPETGNEERGCVATKDIRNGELLLEIPSGCCLAAGPGLAEALAADSSVGAALDRAGITKEDAALAVTVAAEMKSGDASAWWPYIKVLGSQVNDTFPLFFDEADLDALESPPLKESLEVTSQAIAAVAAHRGDVTDKELRSAWQLVRSRRFGSDLGTVMIPLGDFLNHSFYPSCGWDAPTAQRPDSWILRARIDMSAGDSLNFQYCEDPNHMLLSTLGIVMEENPHSRIMVRPCDLRRAVRSVLNTGGPEDFTSWRESEIDKQFPDPEEPGCGLAMFLVGRRPNGIQWNPLWLDMVGMAVMESPEKHWSNEPGGTEVYLAAFEKASWSVFPRTLEADPGAPSAATSNQLLAANLRLGQKKLLSDAIASLRTRLSGQG